MRSFVSCVRWYTKVCSFRASCRDKNYCIHLLDCLYCATVKTIHVVLTFPILGFDLNFKAVNSVTWFCSDGDSFAGHSLYKYNHRTMESCGCGGDEEVFRCYCDGGPSM
jgi:hypothetical protein